MEQEREVGAWFTIDTRLEVSDSSAAQSDNIDATISYADVYEIIKREMKTPSNLLENVCARIMEALFGTFTTIEKITITLKKDTPPMGGDRLNAAVTMRASR